MIYLQILLLISILGGGMLLLAQNWSPVLPLVILGSQVAVLPLALWILVFVVAGILTSAILQFLNYLAGRFTRGSVRTPPPPPSPRSRYSETPSTRPPKARRSSKQGRIEEEPVKRIFKEEWEFGQEWDFEDASTVATPTPDVQEWGKKDEPEDEDWNIEKPPVQPTQPTFKRSLDRSETIKRESVNFEVRQEPKNVSQSGSVYTQQYREAKSSESGLDKKEQVYDANYRVITPPVRQPPPETTEEEEDWI